MLSGPSNFKEPAHLHCQLYVLGLYMHMCWMHLTECCSTGLTLTREAQHHTDNKSYPSRQKDLYRLSQIHQSVSFSLLKQVSTDTEKGLHRKLFTTLLGINLFGFQNTIFNEYLRCPLVPFALQLNTQEGSMHRKEAEMQEMSFRT